MTSDSAPDPYPDFDQMPIGGTWTDGGSEHSAADVNPWDGSTLTEIRLADAEDVDRAYARARDVSRDWAAPPPAVRAGVFREAAAVMERRKVEITGWLSRESGGTLAKAELEWGLVRAVMLEASALPHHVEGRIMPTDIPGKESRVYRQPVGVVGVISPWNFPMQLSNRSVAPALAVGNAVVLKPAGDTPVTGGLLLARILEEAGLPPGLLSVVVGKGSEIGDPFVQHPIPRVISFTGSTPVGEGIASKAGIKRLALELGGNGPIVVLDDADVELGVEAAVFGSFFHQGQICMRANRLVVDVAVADEFTDRLVDRAKGLAVGDPTDPDTDIGPVINRSQLESITELVGQAVDGGAEQLVGGDPVGPNGLGLPPHVLVGPNDCATAANEVFGPVITIVRTDGEDEALAVANDTEYGLSSAVFTADVERGVRFARRVDAGMTHVNDAPVNDDPNTAFGGVGASGIGRFGGHWSIEEFTTDHWITVQHEPRSYPI